MLCCAMLYCAVLPPTVQLQTWKGLLMALLSSSPCQGKRHVMSCSKRGPQNKHGPLWEWVGRYWAAGKKEGVSTPIAHHTTKQHPAPSTSHKARNA